jgi:hypothetical protein
MLDDHYYGIQTKHYYEQKIITENIITERDKASLQNTVKSIYRK